MKPVYIIGDCHLARVYENDENKTHDFKLVMWGTAGTKAWGLDWNYLEESNAISTGGEIGLIDKVPFKNINDDGIVMVWLGYIDIRQFLPKYKNADLLVKKYLEDVTNYFKNSKIVIVEPLPQFTKMHLKYEGISPEYTYKERQEQNSLFLEALRKYVKEFNIDYVISQDDLFSAMGIEELDDSVLRNVAPHPSDALAEKYSTAIYNLFLTKIKEIQNI
jgi:hypothetical protein